MTDYDRAQTVKLLGFAIHNETLVGEEKLPHSRASSSFVIVHDDGPAGTFLRPPPAGQSIPIASSSQMHLNTAETSSRSGPSLKFEHSPFSRHATIKSTFTEDNAAIHEIIAKPLPALITPNIPSFPLNSSGSKDTVSFTYARLQTTMRFTY
ncbi:hypothetical protein FRC07_010662 [Ceratobasidium sp. 392]|nr:hypothetical protein FRC07_010662 [Ceratobasidium sp. 392]